MYAGDESEWQVIPCQSEGEVCWEIGPDGFGKNPTESNENLKQGHICKYVSNVPIQAIFVINPKVLYV